MNRVLKVFQLSTAKKTTSGNALAHIMGAHRNSLAFITEPQIFHGKVCGFPNAAFNILHHQGNLKRCRAAIIASKGVELCALPSHSDEDTASAIIVLDGRKTCIVSSYMDITVEKVPEMVHKTAHFAVVNGYGLLVCTDSNAHNPLWGSPDLNSRGRLVKEDIIYSSSTTVRSLPMLGTLPPPAP